MTLRQGSRFGFWNAMPAILTGPRHLVAENDDAAVVGRDQPGDELHQRRLAATGRADHRGELAAADVQRRALQRQHAARHAAIGERDVADIDGRTHARPLNGQAKADHSLRSAAGGRNWLVKTSSAFGRALKS